MRSKSEVILFGLLCLTLLSGCRQEPAQSPVIESWVTPAKPFVASDPALHLERGVIRTSGIGRPPRDSTEKGQALARRAAIVDGQRHLAQKLAELKQRANIESGVVNAGTGILVENYTIVEEKSLADGGYRVILEMKLDNTLLERLRQR